MPIPGSLTGFTWNPGTREASQRTRRGVEKKLIQIHLRPGLRVDVT